MFMSIIAPLGRPLDATRNETSSRVGSLRATKRRKADGVGILRVWLGVNRCAWPCALLVPFRGHPDLFRISSFGFLSTFGPRPSDPSWFPPVFVRFVGFCKRLTISGLMIFTGRCLQRRRYPSFCLIVAALECLCIPVGTVLGIFTLRLLWRSVQQSSPPPTLPPGSG
jgi:hypothetical protein